MSQVVELESIRDCLRSGHPCPVATCSPDGTPHLSYVSQVRYLDAERVATSRQSFNRAPTSTFSQALITRSGTGEQFRLDLRYLHSVTEGEEFEVMRANLEAIASHTGIGPDFRLRGLDVHRVLRCLRVSKVTTEIPPSTDLLRALEQFSRRLEGSTTYEDATHEIMLMLGDLFGFTYAVLFALDSPTRRLFAIAGSGTRARLSAQRWSSGWV